MKPSILWMDIHHESTHCSSCSTVQASSNQLSDKQTPCLSFLSVSRTLKGSIVSHIKKRHKNMTRTVDGPRTSAQTQGRQQQTPRAAYRPCKQNRDVFSLSRFQSGQSACVWCGISSSSNFVRQEGVNPSYDATGTRPSLCTTNRGLLASKILQKKSRSTRQSRSLSPLALTCQAGTTYCTRPLKRTKLCLSNLYSEASPTFFLFNAFFTAAALPNRACRPPRPPPSSIARAVLTLDKY